MISVTRIDKSTLDETVTHDGKGEAVIRVAVAADGSSMEFVYEDRRDGTITRMRASSEVRTRRSLAHNSLISGGPTLLRT